MWLISCCLIFSVKASLFGDDPKLRILIASVKGRHSRRLPSVETVIALSDEVFRAAGFSLDARGSIRAQNKLETAHAVFGDLFSAARETMQNSVIKATLSKKTDIFRMTFNLAKRRLCRCLGSLRLEMESGLARTLTSRGGTDAISIFRFILKVLVEFEAFANGLENHTKKWGAAVPAFETYSLVLGQKLPQLIHTDPFGARKLQKAWADDHIGRKTLVMAFRSLLRTLVDLDLLILQHMSTVLTFKSVVTAEEHAPIQMLDIVSSLILNLANLCFSSIADAYFPHLTRQRVLGKLQRYISIWKTFVADKQDLSRVQLDPVTWRHDYTVLKKTQTTKTAACLALAASM